MEKSVFDPNQQTNDISSKIVAGLERISEVFKSLLWEKAKSNGLSPIQIQILIFINFHKQKLCNVSHLAKEFNVTKPTISDAIKVLDKKGLITKDFSSADNRSYLIDLSSNGKKMVSETQDFAFGCKFYQKNENTDYCNLLEKELMSKDIRLDCPEFAGKASG